MDCIKDPGVRATFMSYPDSIRRRLMQLRQLVLDVAAESDDIGPVEESLKWGEPSYVARGGSPVRLAWKDSRPEHVALYFNCNSKLVDTFRELYADTFEFEGNRAIVFRRDERLPIEPLKHCISLALRYHRLKHLSLLGA